MVDILGLTESFRPLPLEIALKVGIVEAMALGIGGAAVGGALCLVAMRALLIYTDMGRNPFAPRDERISSMSNLLQKALIIGAISGGVLGVIAASQFIH